MSRGPSLANLRHATGRGVRRAFRRGTQSLSAGIEIAHHDVEHLPGQPGLALGHMRAGEELAGLVGQIVVGARHGGQTGASAADDSCPSGRFDSFVKAAGCRLPAAR